MDELGVGGFWTKHKRVASKNFSGLKTWEIVLETASVVNVFTTCKKISGLKTWEIVLETASLVNLCTTFPCVMSQCLGAAMFDLA